VCTPVSCLAQRHSNSSSPNKYHSASHTKLIAPGVVGTHPGPLGSHLGFFFFFCGVGEIFFHPLMTHTCSLPEHGLGQSESPGLVPGSYTYPIRSRNDWCIGTPQGSGSPGLPEIWLELGLLVPFSLQASPENRSLTNHLHMLLGWGVNPKILRCSYGKMKLFQEGILTINCSLTC
jgi:hypothetical protein